ncbi:MAG: T9SS type A sorting domain-containing protein [Crocinitomicaceae bacterium]|nr:T9SS type A sorting domain-containing protein [Crocinitomicaceae bacterium]
MKKISFLLFFLFLIIENSYLLAQPQEIDWQDMNGDWGNDTVSRIVYSPNGFFWVVSNEGTDPGSSRIVLYKYTPEGVTNGYHTFPCNYPGDQLARAACISSDSLLLIGAGTDQQAGCVQTENPVFGLSDPWILGKDDNYNNIFDNVFQGNGHDIIMDILNVDGGGTIAFATSNSTYSNLFTILEFDAPHIGDYDLWIFESSSNGTLLWQQGFGSTGRDEPIDAEYTNDGGYVVALRSNGPADGDKTENNIGFDDYWIIKFDGLGNIAWQNTIGGTGIDNVTSIVTTSDGYLVGGFSNSPAGFDKTENSLGDFDFWVVKLDLNGNVVWDKVYGGSGFDKLAKIVPSSEGGYLLCGTSDSPSSAQKAENSMGFTDYWVVKINDSGSIIWDNTIGGAGKDVLTDAVQDTIGRYLLGGYSNSPVSGDVTESSNLYNGLTFVSDSNNIWMVMLQPILPSPCMLVFPSVECGQSVPFSGVCSSHNDPNKSIVLFEWDYENDGIYDFSGPSGSIVYPTTGTYSLKLRVTDNVGKSDSLISTVTIVDTQTPTATAPLPVTLLCIETYPPDVSIITDEADNCTNTPTVQFVSDVSNGSCPEIITRTYSVTDDEGNTISLTQTITVNDTLAPNPNSGTPQTVNAICEANPSTLLSTDPCTFTTITGVPDVSFPITTIGTTVITWTYTDACGNDTSQTQTVIVNAVDNTVNNNGISLTANQPNANYQWLDCNNSNAPINGETNQTFYPTSNGNYAVEITVGSCVETSNCESISTIGYSELGTWSITTYPNPTSNQIHVLSTIPLNRIELFDVLGKLILSKTLSAINTADMDLTNYESGTYFLHVYANDQNEVIKIIKE